MKKYFKIFITALMVVIFTGCEDFLDINDNPNAPLDVRVTQLLPAIEERLGSAVGMAGLSGTASFLMQYNVTRGNLNDYIIASNTGSGTWNSLYTDCLTDIREIKRLGAANGYNAYTGVAKIMEAYIYSVLVDYWGDVPYTDAVKGSLNPTPDFDNDAEVYDAIFALIDAGLADLALPVNFAIRTDDRIYGGDLVKWRKFANTLKLKLYNQIRLVEDVDAEVATLLATPANLIASEAEDFQLPYGTSTAPDNRNPSYPGQYAAGTKTSPNPYFYEVMNNLNTFGHGGNIFPVVDPRIPYYWHRQLVAGGTAQNNIAYPLGAPNNKVTPSGFVSIFSFSFNIDPNEGFDQSASATVMGLFPIGGKYDDNSGAKALNNGYGITPQRILTFNARKFIEAELALTNVTAADDSALLAEAINASFAKVNQVATAAAAPTISNANRDTYRNAILNLYVNAADDEERLQILMTQKWIASYGFALDAFTDFRRTGYPILHDGNTDTVPVTIRSRDYVTLLVYPDNEILLNPNSPGQNNPYLTKVFWDN
jgi:hypothetical protein